MADFQLVSKIFSFEVVTLCATSVSGRLSFSFSLRFFLSKKKKEEEYQDLAKILFSLKNFFTMTETCSTTMYVSNARAAQSYFHCQLTLLYTLLYITELRNVSLLRWSREGILIELARISRQPEMKERERGTINWAVQTYLSVYNRWRVRGGGRKEKGGGRHKKAPGKRSWRFGKHHQICTHTHKDQPNPFVEVRT